jgi:hypothetical protein
VTATLPRQRNRDSLTLAQAERELLAAGYRLTVYPQPPADTIIARLNAHGFHATVVLAHSHVHQIVMLSRQDSEDGPLRTVSVKTGFHRNHEFINLDITGAVHIAEQFAHDIEHAGQLRDAGSARWAVTR